MLLIMVKCLNENLFIIENQENNLLNQRNELISICRYKNKFKLMNHQTWPLCAKCPCTEFFSGANTFPTFGLNMETYRVSSRIHSECGPDRPRKRILFAQLTSEHCFVSLIPLYCKFTVTSWLNDCEGMNLVVSTHVVLFH